VSRLNNLKSYLSNPKYLNAIDDSIQQEIKDEAESEKSSKDLKALFLFGLFLVALAIAKNLGFY